MEDVSRCNWANGNPLMVKYHDEEWGVPLHDDKTLFEFLVLEGAQAGLSWETILNKREAYRQAFDGFDPEKVAEYGPEKIESLLNNAGIVRNRLKIQSAITNAKIVLEVQKEWGSLDAYIWSFADPSIPINHANIYTQLPAKTPASEVMSKALLKRGFKFVGPTICYAFMQAVGMVNDHTGDCFKRPVTKTA